MRFATLEQLQQAYRNGELDQACALRIDNDCTSVWVEDEQVFEMHPAELVEQALDLLGVPHEPV